MYLIHHYLKKQQQKQFIPPSVNSDTDETLTTINFDERLIKAHGQDGIVVYLLQMISDSLKSSQ